MTRILSVAFPTLPTDRLQRGNPQPADARPPLATVKPVKGAQRIAAVDRQAAARAIRPGMGLADARAVCPELGVAEADPPGEAETLRHLLDWSRRFTPLAALDAPDGLLLDITGAAHLQGGEDGLIEAAESGLGALGFAAAAAVADTPEAAWALARFGTIRRAAPGGIAALADALPLAALRLDGATLDALAQAGLRRIGDVLIRPRAPIAARFGQALFQRLDGLLGLHHSAITPSFPVPSFVAERRFASAVARIEGVEATILALARRLCEQLAGAGQGARRVEALFFRVDGAVKSIRVGTSRPTRDAASLTRLFREKLARLGEDGLDTGYGFDLIRLGAEIAEPLAAAQDDLDAQAARQAEVDLAALVDRLGARLGPTRVLRLHDTNRHTPEEAAAAVPALQESAETETFDEIGLERPLRLFDRPEPIDTVASVPDGPPAQFRWRRTLHEIAAIEGPERIAAPWWISAGPTRDYFHAEDGDGRRFWIFREGLYGAAETRPRWFLHGLFG